MVWPMLLGGALGAVGSVIAGNRAAKAQTKSTDDQINFAHHINDQNQQRFQPYAQAGQNALATYTGQLGSNYETSPYANYLLNDGMDAIEASAAARGGLFSGQTAVDLDQHRMGVVAQDRDNWLNRQLGVANMGQSAAGFQAQQANNLGSQVGNAYANRGNALSAQYTNQNNAFQNLLGQGFQAYGYMRGQ